jgi:hypothetical protein
MADTNKPSSSSFRARGECNGNAKLKSEQVIEIRERYSRRMQKGQHVTMQELADRFHICLTQVRQILLRRVWMHLP